MTPKQALRATDRSVGILLFSIALLWDVTIWIAKLVFEGPGFFNLPSDHLVQDFAFFWGGAKLFWLGKLAWIFDPLRFNAWLVGQVAPGSMQMFATWSYPPTMLLLLLPFGLLPLPAAYLVWLIGTPTLLFLVLHYVLGNRWVTLAVLVSPAALFSLNVGQNGALTASLLIAGLWLVDRRPLIAGACIGALVIKPRIGWVIPFALVAGGRWRTIASAAAVSATIVAATCLIFGFGAWGGFADTTVPFMASQLLHEYGIPPQHAMPTIWVTLQGWGADTRFAALGQGLSTLFAIALAVWAWRLREADPLWRNALTCALPLLATPFGYVYDAIPTMLAVALVAQAGFSERFAWLERPTLALLWIWPALAIPWTSLFELRPIGGYLLVVMVLCLWRRIVRGSGSSQPFS